MVGSQSVAEVLVDFTAQLRQIKQTLVDRDFVSLTDLLLYENRRDQPPLGRGAPTDPRYSLPNIFHLIKISLANMAA